VSVGVGGEIVGEYAVIFVNVYILFTIGKVSVVTGLVILYNIV